MTLILIEGKMNSGKTLVATFYAIKDFREGRKIITNYNINIPHYEINKDFLEWLSKNQPDTTGMSFFFDELWLWLDSYNTMGSKILNYFFLQSSKGDTKVYMTAQKDKQISLRTRENAHSLISCERKLLLNNKMHKVSNKIRDLGSKYYPYIYIKVSEYEPSMMGLDLYGECLSRFYLKADWLFSFYNTNQKMKP